MVIGLTHFKELCLRMISYQMNISLSSEHQVTTYVPEDFFKQERKKEKKSFMIYTYFVLEISFTVGFP